MEIRKKYPNLDPVEYDIDKVMNWRITSQAKIDDKILDRARRLIKSRFAERRNALPNEVLRRMRTHDLHSSPTWNSVRAACEEEISTKAKIVWDSIQEVHKALGSPIKETEMLRTDLKEEASQHIEIAVSEASELMKKHLSSMKPSVRLFDLGNTRHEVIERISVKIDLYVDSLLCRQADTTHKIELLEKGGQGKTNIPDYKALNLSNRTIMIGTETYHITSEKVWDFIKDLHSAFRDDRLVPMFDGATNNKHNVDRLRKLLSNENLHKLIIFVNGGYKLNPEVKILESGQIGIRKTHLSRKPTKN